MRLNDVSSGRLSRAPGGVTAPGLANTGQPFWGTDILDRTPAEATEMAAEKGYNPPADRGASGTESLDDDTLSFSDDAPTCGIGGGSVIDDALMPGPEC